MLNTRLRTKKHVQLQGSIQDTSPKASINDTFRIEQGIIIFFPVPRSQEISQFPPLHFQLPYL